MRFFCLKAAAIATAALATIVAAVPAHADATDDALAAMRAASEKYRDVNAALAAGYIRDPMNHCFTAEMMGMPADWGVMGVTTSATPVTLLSEVNA